MEEVLSHVTPDKLDRYLAITKKALDLAKSAPLAETKKKEAMHALDMAERYYSDALHFKKQGNAVLAFAAINYAHGWLDCAASSGFFIVHDNTLFTVDGKGDQR